MVKGKLIDALRQLGCLYLGLLFLLAYSWAADSNADIANEQISSVLVLFEADNQYLIKRLNELQSLGEDLTRLSSEILKEYNAITKERDQTKSQIVQYGLNQVLAQVLLDRFRRLPSLSQLHATNRWLQRTTRALVNERFQYEQQAQHFQEITVGLRWWSERVKAAHPEKSFPPEAVLLPLLKGLGEQRRTFLEQIVLKISEVLEQISDAHSRLLELVRQLGTFRAELMQHLLWTPNAPPLGRQTFIDSLRAIQWFCRSIKEARVVFADWLNRPPILSIVGIVIFWLLYHFKWAVDRAIQDFNERILAAETDSFLATAGAMLLYAGLGIGPLIPVICIAFELVTISLPYPLWHCLGLALLWSGCWVGGVKVLRCWASEGGLLERHLRCDATLVSWIRKVTGRVAWLLGLAIFIVSFWQYAPYQEYSVSIGRLVFVVSLLIFAIWLIRAARCGGRQETEESATEANERCQKRLHLMIASLVVLIVLGGLSCLGYYYTSILISSKLLVTAWLAVAAYILYMILLRWVRVRQRKLAWQRAKLIRRKRLEDSNSSLSQKVEGKDEVLSAVVEPADSLTRIGEQARSLVVLISLVFLAFCLWRVWRDVIPALGVLDQVTIWTVRSAANGQTVGTPVTLLNLLTAIAAFAIAVISAKNVPGLVELFILNRLALGEGTRYALKTLVQYMIVVAGVVTPLVILKVDWGKLGWIITALSVGIGFGLQEVVANFVCGIVLLLERQVRVGDIVSVGDTVGVVKRIQIRSTTILNWDRQEVIIPNKEFITARVVNWTLSDTVNRIVIQVGLAYGSDTEKATQILLEICKNHPEVLKDPEPRVTFEAFDDSSLRFVIRCYLSRLDKRLQTIHELCSEIHRRLNEEGIEIAFPQLDVHIKDSSPLQITRK